MISKVLLLRSLLRWFGLRGTAGTQTPRNQRGASDCPSNPSSDEALPLLADAIVGSSKSAVARVLGPPRGAAVSSDATGVQPATFWLADTWYYPMPHNRPLAMAIRFSNDSARAVEFIGSSKVGKRIAP